LASEWRATAIRLLTENVHGLIFVVGAVWLYVGLYSLSPPAANIVTGGILLAIGAWPYLTRAYLARSRPR